jgi:hypothetical protein
VAGNEAAVVQELRDGGHYDTIDGPRSGAPRLKKRVGLVLQSSSRGRARTMCKLNITIRPL